MVSKETAERSDNRIVEELFARNESAISFISEKYGRYYHKIAYNILANEKDSEECVNDTYLKLWDHIPPDRPKSLKAYSAKIVRNIALNKYREKGREKRIPSECTYSLEELEDCIPDLFSVEKEYDDHRLKQIMDSFVHSLSKRRKYIFICRYYCKDSVESIAKTLNLSVSTISHELSEIRKKLKERLIKEELWDENRSS